MRISELIERLGRTVFEAPFGAMSQAISDSPEVAEIRIAVLDEVKKKVQRAGGKALFPYNIVRVVICTSAPDAGVFERDFFRRFFEEEVRKSLARDSCRFPDDLRVEVRVADDDSANEDNWLRIETLAEDVEPEPSEPARARRTARLVVVAGVPNKTEIALQKTRTNIGRLVDVYKSEGMSRRNDLASPRSIPSTAPSRASTPTSYTTRRPASTGCSMIAGIRAATRPRTTAGFGSCVTAWARKCIATRVGPGSCRAMRFTWARPC
jgi:hypothetical protein